MTTKLFHLDGNTGVFLIGDYDINLDAVTNPGDYIAKLNFHSGLAYLRIKSYVTKPSITLDGLTRNVITWDDGSKCGGCYITTACIAYKGLSDDCYMLQTLRKFRDEYMLATDEDSKLVEEYYRTAPAYLDKLIKKSDCNHVFEIIYTKYLEPAVNFIESDEMFKAKLLYTELFNYVKGLVE